MQRHAVTYCYAPTACRQTGSGSISPPCSVLFTFPLTVLVRYRSLGVFSLTGWARCFTQDLVPALLRMPLGFNRQSCTGFLSMTAFSKAFHLTLSCHVSGPINPVSPRRHGFGLFRVRSPLLTESLFIFSSYGYLDVSVPHVRLPYGMTGLQPAGLPHSDIRDQGLFAPPRAFRSLSRPSSPPESQGIHRLPLLTFSHLVHDVRVDIS